MTGMATRGIIRSVGAAQTTPVRGDVAVNLEQHLRLARLAAREDVQVLVFPELSLTGYELDLARGLAFSERDPRLAPLVEAAASGSLTLIAGAPVRMGRKLHIGAFIVSPDGMVGVYTKHHLGAFSASASCDGVVPPAEATVFEPGRSNPLIRLGRGMAAIAVCADAGRPSHASDAAARGAGTYLASMFVIPSEFAHETAGLRQYAVRHAMAVVFANYGAPSGGLDAAGRSAIWSETGERLVQLEPAGAGLAIATETPSGWRARLVTGS